MSPRRVEMSAQAKAILRPKKAAKAKPQPKTREQWPKGSLKSSKLFDAFKKASQSSGASTPAGSEVSTTAAGEDTPRSLLTPKEEPADEFDSRSLDGESLDPDELDTLIGEDHPVKHLDVYRGASPVFTCGALGADAKKGAASDSDSDDDKPLGAAPPKRCSSGASTPRTPRTPQMPQVGLPGMTPDYEDVIGDAKSGVKQREYEDAASTGFCLRRSNVGQAWSRAIKRDSKLKSMYEAVGTSYAKQREFRQQWAQTVVNDMKRSRSHAEAYEEEDAKVGEYMTEKQISKELGFDDEAARNYATWCEAELEKGEKYKSDKDWLVFDEQTQRTKYYFIKRYAMCR